MVQTRGRAGRLRRWILALSIVGLFTPQSAGADALSDLNKEFRSAYSLAADQTLSSLRASVPVLVNRFGQIALYRPGIAEPEVFSMAMKQYLQARTVAHAAAAVYVRLAPYGMGALDRERLTWLVEYQALLSGAAKQIRDSTDTPAKLLAVQIGVLDQVRSHVQRIHQQGKVEQTTLEHLGRTVHDAIQTNLTVAAASQLNQFRAQIDRWRADYSALDWKNAVVVIIGGHQVRKQYLQRQFFDWMLMDEPDAQNRVVFAETLTPPRPLDKETPIDAMLLLSKVRFDKGLSSTFFGDPLLLQSDLLGPAAAEIIGQWPSP